MDDQQQKRRRRRRLVLIPCPLQGHINPILQLATLLHSQSRGLLSITIVHTNFNSPNPSMHPDFTFLPISDGLSPSQSTQDFITLFSLLNHNCATPFRECMVNEILSQQHEPPVACIISDAVMHFTQSVADSLQLPRIVLRTNSPTNFVVFVAFPLLHQRGFLPIKESELEAPVPELPPLKVKDIPMVKTDGFEGLFTLVIEMVNQTKASAGLIFNSFESLEHTALESLRQEFPAPNFAIGPFHKFATATYSSLLTQDRTCISWLDTQAPSSVIYISFGSIAAIDEAQLVEMALGIANSEQPFLWVIRPGLVIDHNKSGEDKGQEIINEDLTNFLPEKFNEIMRLQGGRGYIVQWAPQQEVLAHPAVGGFWTHNGWNSTLESICEGVPMLCWPCFGDQMVNARYVSQVWRVGFQLENGLEHGEIETYIKRLMVQENNREREEMMVRVKDLQDRAECCIKKGGSSFKSLEYLTDYIFSM